MDYDKFKKVVDIIPIMIGAAYLSGFVIVNTFFFKYKIFAASIFESEYLSAGTIFILIFGTLFLFIFFSNKKMKKLPDNEIEFYLIACLRVLLLAYTFSFLIIDISITESKYIQIYNYGVAGFWIAFILINNVHMPQSLRWIVGYLIAVVGNIFVFITFEECRFLLGLTYFCGYIWIYSIDDFYEEKLDKLKMVGGIFGLVSLAMIFGYLSYDNIAKRYGGGRPEKIALIVDSIQENKLPKQLKINAEHIVNAQLLHSSEKEYSLSQDSFLFTLDKSIFIGYLSKQ